ncbi:MAG: hypothetical protein GY714_27860 [Desulfobacterales bacterium]|nr:hypothetical protein [Desulfobacterales bacterium]MCP4160342.1 hypothetical protein [Deltaproteobacteria bacterium]
MTKNIEKTILQASEHAHELIHKLHRSDPDNETFEQVGLLAGHKTVVDFIDYGEIGCALHHLLYMIHESDIEFPRKQMLRLHHIAHEIGEKNHYSKENQVNLTTEQISKIYNTP